MHDHKKRAAALALSAAVLAAGLVGCGQSEQAEVAQTNVLVDAQPAEVGGISLNGTYIGTVSAAETVNVVPLVSGTVEEVNVAVGSVVTEGEQLCRFDDTSAQLSLASAQASYNSAAASAQATLGGSWNLTGIQTQTSIDATQASLDALRDSLDKAEDQKDDLRDARNAARTAMEQAQLAVQQSPESATAKTQLEEAAKTYQEAATAYESIKSSIDTIETNITSTEIQLKGTQDAQSVTNSQVYAETANTLDKSLDAARVGVSSAAYQASLYQITAPITGVVQSVNVTADNLFASGQVAFTITNDEAKTITFYVTEEVAQQLTSGQPVTVSHNGSSYSGTITEIGTAVDASRGLFRVKATLYNAAGLSNGVSVELTTTTRTETGSIVIPSDAVYYQSGQAYVYVEKDGVAQETAIETGIYDDNDILVASGLNVGDNVIVSWSPTLQNGVAVTLSTAAGESEAAQEETQPDASSTDQG